MKRLRHPCIIRFRDVWRSQSAYGHQLNILMDYADDGTLESKIVAKMNEANEYGGEM